jgi:mono/diheme cytochrome c family protein
VARTEFREEAPPPLTMESLRRGRERFEIYCVPCHGYTGQGDGIVALRGLRSRPPSFHSEELRKDDLDEIVDVIRNGFGAMPSYAYQVRPADRWAIAGYIKALQLSQWVDARTLPAAERRRLDKDSQ